MLDKVKVVKAFYAHVCKEKRIMLKDNIDFKLLADYIDKYDKVFDIIQLRITSKLKYINIADKLGLSVSTIQGRLQKATSDVAFVSRHPEMLERYNGKYPNNLLSDACIMGCDEEILDYCLEELSPKYVSTLNKLYKEHKTLLELCLEDNKSLCRTIKAKEDALRSLRCLYKLDCA